MLKINDISYSIAGRQLLANASATIPSGHKVGIVGRNGTGKTTLFKLITNELGLDDGNIEIPKKMRIGGIAQEAPASDDSLLETVLSADTERTELLKEAETASDPNRIADIHGRLSDIDAYSAEARAASILSGLGFSSAAQARPCHEFSGGWRMRVALAGVLFAQPDILMLDEPTNYLDLEGTIWLETYLKKYPHSILIISHDRQLLNTSVNAILHLTDKQLTLYQGNYDTFDSVRRAKLAEQDSMARKQQATREHLQSFVDRFRAKASKAKQAQSRIKMLEKMEPIAAGVENAVAAFDFPTPEELSPPILRLEDTSVGYDEKPILKDLNLRIDQSDRIALLGANGQGKSTLSKLLADRLIPMNGNLVRSSKLKIGYFAQHQVDELHLDETPLQHITREFPGETPSKLRSRLARGGIGPEQALTEVGRLSGGQKARLSLLLATVEAPHLLILDEPTNHLDIESRESLVFALAAYEGAVILVSHDPHLVNAVADTLWLVKDGQVNVYYEDLNAYKKLLLSERGLADKSEKPKKVKKKRLSHGEQRKILTPYQLEVTKCEERLNKIMDIKEKIDKALADPDIYTNKNPEKFENLSKKRAEAEEAIIKAETLWVSAEENLEKARLNL
ncbi:ATP-binding cassette domain-containing protein [Amylibacter sp.]|nr:ATP-binding cassette domain-containing protein [Amylibacter sp.]MDB4146286.1 ATP-binding cassette domain-containing protein [Amylibacter sp.]MDB9851796.1 ATP-binding cassette domain-containing protein [Amylibacter sp.]MDC1252885.1 ATP-binding cassette domain-containing protein [Amylibacter sp.]MDC1269773.1 ATP-binding cassette domain-containing protein [Amylibacter sp.]|tara:strand:- start:4714 stop:6585 length:1872 start_codon:yes stop_codon:yes gene_type:complete